LAADIFGIHTPKKGMFMALFEDPLNTLVSTDSQGQAPARKPQTVNNRARCPL
jgi:hypothetical protein